MVLWYYGLICGFVVSPPKESEIKRHTYWKSGMLEYWKDSSNIPLFQHSTIPAICP